MTLTLELDAGLRQKWDELLQNLAAEINLLVAELVQKMECMDLSRCSCLGGEKSTSESYSIQQERQAACALLDHLDKVECPVPVALLKPLTVLLLSNDLELQRNTSLSLANLLFNNKVSAEQVIETEMLVPLLETLQSGDPTVQWNSCQCLALLASSACSGKHDVAVPSPRQAFLWKACGDLGYSGDRLTLHHHFCLLSAVQADSNREAIVLADGVIPLLVLSKYYDPLVQQNAVWALSNLTLSERTIGVLCQEGAIPVLTLLLQSSNYEVQFYSCSALGNIATLPEHHLTMLAFGDCFLLKSLLTLMSSAVEKNASQACRCLRILAGSVGAQEQSIYLDCVLPLKAMLCSHSLSLAEAAITLLSEISSQHPNRESLLNEELLQVLGQMLLSRGSRPTIIKHSVVTITNLSSVWKAQQAVMDSECVRGLLQALLSSVASEENILCIISCLHHLSSRDLLQSHLTIQMTPEHVSCLVKFSAQRENAELSFRSASIITKLNMDDHVIKLLKPHYPAILEYLLMFLKNQEVRFPQLGIVTLCNLKRDREFSEVMNSSELTEQLKRVHEQTEQTRLLLLVIQNPPHPDMFTGASDTGN